MKIIVFKSLPDQITSRKASDQPWHWHIENKGRITTDGEAHPDRAKAIRAAKGVVASILKEVGVRPQSVQWTKSPRADLGEGAVELRIS
jgi:hypothetical protein